MRSFAFISIALRVEVIGNSHFSGVSDIPLKRAGKCIGHGQDDHDCNQQYG